MVKYLVHVTVSFSCINFTKLCLHYDSLSTHLRKFDLKQNTFHRPSIVAHQSEIKLLNTSSFIVNTNIVLVFAGIFLMLIILFILKKYKQRKQAALNHQKSIDDQIEKETKEKLELADIKQTLLTNISHDIRTPLTLIRVPILNRMGYVAGKDKEIYANILENTEQLISMVNEIDEVNKLKSGTLALTKSKFNLNPILESIHASFIPLFNKKEIEISWNIEIAEIWIEADKQKLKIVLNNLFINAYQNAPNGTKLHFNCAIESAEKGENLHFKITNNTEPMREEEISKLFDRSYRATTAGYKGSGIGLSITQQIIIAHKGKIKAYLINESTICFEIKLPVIYQDSEMNNASNVNTILQNTSMPYAANYKPYNKKHTLLIVEDNEAIMKLLCNLLSPQYKIITAQNGIIGEAKAIEKIPDLIVSDIIMPLKDGISLTKSIKSNINTAHIPILLLTAKTGLINKLKGFQFDADGYITKPFHPEELFAHISHLIRQRENLKNIFNKNLLDPTNISDNEQNEDKFIQKVNKILENHYQDGDYSVAQFSLDLGLNRNSLHNKLKALTGLSASQYIKCYRLEKAKELILKSNLSITSIAIDTGFNSSQAFNKAFKERFESTPSDFKSSI